MLDFRKAAKVSGSFSPDKIVLRAADRVYPKLEELLVASGSQFNALKYLPDETETRHRWVASSTNAAADHYGPSPAESVTRLWLAPHATERPCDQRA